MLKRSNPLRFLTRNHLLGMPIREYSNKFSKSYFAKAERIYQINLINHREITSCIINCRNAIQIIHKRNISTNSSYVVPSDPFEGSHKECDNLDNLNKLDNLNDLSVKQESPNEEANYTMLEHGFDCESDSKKYSNSESNSELNSESNSDPERGNPPGFLLGLSFLSVLIAFLSGASTLIDIIIHLILKIIGDNILAVLTFCIFIISSIVGGICILLLKILYW